MILNRLVIGGVLHDSAWRISSWRSKALWNTHYYWSAFHAAKVAHVTSLIVYDPQVSSQRGAKVYMTLMEAISSQELDTKDQLESFLEDLQTAIQDLKRHRDHEWR